MLFDSIRSQINIIFRKNTAIVAFYIMLGFVLMNYIGNILLYRGNDVVELYQPVKLLLLSDENQGTPYGFYLMQVYPILIILPAGFSLITDKKSNQILFLCARVGSRNYYLGKIIAVFFAAVIIFSIPLFLEVILNYFSFPKDAIGNPMNLPMYSEEYLSIVRGYPFYQIYVSHPYLYVSGWILLFGFTAGMLNVITIAVSTFAIPYKVLLFLPIYIILNGMYWIGDFFGADINHFFMLRMFGSGEQAYAIFFGTILILFIAAILIIMKKAREDCL